LTNPADLDPHLTNPADPDPNSHLTNLADPEPDSHLTNFADPGFHNVHQVLGVFHIRILALIRLLNTNLKLSEQVWVISVQILICSTASSQFLS
jgi:hypothetical protein